MKRGSMIHPILALTLRAAFGVRYGIPASAVRPNAMDDMNAENAGAVFCRPPGMAQVQKTQEQFSAGHHACATTAKFPVISEYSAT
jgi:hypothetical protein